LTYLPFKGLNIKRDRPSSSLGAPHMNRAR